MRTNVARRARSACTRSGVGAVQCHWTVYWVTVSGSVPAFWRPLVRTGTAWVLIAGVTVCHRPLAV